MNGAAAAGGLGVVVRFATVGVGATTVKPNVFDGIPSGFVTLTVQRLSGSFWVVIDMSSWVLLTYVTCADANCVDPDDHATTTVGVFVKLMPVIVTSCGVADPATGMGLTEIIVGAAPAPGAVVKVLVAEYCPNVPFELNPCTFQKYVVASARVGCRPPPLVFGNAFGRL